MNLQKFLRIVNSLFWVLSAGVAILMFIRYHNGNLPNFAVVLIPYYLITFSIALLVLLIVLIRDFSGKPAGTLTVLLSSLLTSMIFAASNDKLSGALASYVTISGIIGLVITILTYLKIFDAHVRKPIKDKLKPSPDAENI